MKRVEVVAFELETVLEWVRKATPGRYELSKLLGDLWTIVRRKRWFGKPYAEQPPSPESAPAVAGMLAPPLPNVRVVHGDGWAPMAPLTHADAVNAQLVAFLREK